MGVSDVPERTVRWFDEAQQTRAWLAHPVGVIRKYADDRGSALAGLVTFQIFMGMLPLLVVVLTVLGWAIDGSERLQRAVLDSTMSQFPVIGRRLQDDVTGLAPSGPWVALAVVGLLWTAAGIYHSVQLALNKVWNVEGVGRQGFVSRHLRALILFSLVVAAALGTAFVPTEAVVGWVPDSLVAPLAAVARSVVAGVLLLGVFRIATAPTVRTVQLLPAALLAGLLWHLLQRVGAWFVTDRLARAQDLYGAIGLVVVTLFWINLLARSAVFANEWAVVSWRSLWPRRIAQPPLTDADREVLTALVRNERRRPEQHVHVEYDADADDHSDHSDGHSDGCEDVDAGEIPSGSR
jgi:YihY family inner membrane protein